MTLPGLVRFGDALVCIGGCNCASAGNMWATGLRAGPCRLCIDDMWSDYVKAGRRHDELPTEEDIRRNAWDDEDDPS